MNNNIKNESSNRSEVLNPPPPPPRESLITRKPVGTAKMSIRKQFILQTTVATLLLVATLFLVSQVKAQSVNLRTVQQNSKNLECATEELRKTSQDLTNLCRIFVATNGVKKYEDEYFYILNWRSGKIPRPQTLKCKLYLGEAISHYNMFKNLGCTDEELNLLDTATEKSNKLADIETQAMKTITKQKFVEGKLKMQEGETPQEFALRILHDKTYHDTVDLIMEPINEFLVKLEERTAQNIATAEKTSSLYLTLMTTFIIITAIDIIIFLFYLNKSVINPITKTAKSFNYLANGDLTHKMEVKSFNEIGQMSSNYNDTIESVTKIIKSIKNNTKELTYLGENLSSNMNETATAVGQINQNVKIVKQQVTTQSTGVTEIATANEQMVKTIEQLNKHIETQSTNVTESSSAVEEMVANINSVTSILQKNQQMIIELQEKSKQIKEASTNSATLTQEVSSESESLLEAASVIQNIASQTNLLAMNAAIEAAHAGDAGKGFAVVADEIRKLAEESSTQGKTITQVLKALKIKIDDIAEDAIKSEKLFIKSFELTEAVKKQEDTIMSAMQEQNTGSSEVLKAMMDINTITSEVRSGSEEMLTSSNQVTQEMRRLIIISENISSSMDEMATGTNQIKNSINEVNTISFTNKEKIENLAKEVDKFTI